jgi:hypothetical protein
MTTPQFPLVRGCLTPESSVDKFPKFRIRLFDCQNFDRHLTIHFPVVGAVNLAHSAFAYFERIS